MCIYICIFYYMMYIFMRIICYILHDSYVDHQWMWNMHVFLHVDVFSWSNVVNRTISHTPYLSWGLLSGIPWYTLFGIFLNKRQMDPNGWLCNGIVYHWDSLGLPHALWDANPVAVGDLWCKNDGHKHTDYVEPECMKPRDNGGCNVLPYQVPKIVDITI